jgi:hypothetical protein
MSLVSWFNSIFPNGDYLPNGMPLGPISAAGQAVSKPADGQNIFAEMNRATRILQMNNPYLQRQAPTREEWAAWRDDPTTKFAFAALRAVASEQKQAWDAFSWHGGCADQQALTEFRTRADTYESLESGSYEQFCAWAGVEPDPMPAEDEERA